MANGSFACTIKPATAIEKKRKNAEIRVAKPMSKKMEQTTSAKIIRMKDGVAPIPSGSPNFIGPSPTRFINFGKPWVSINAQADARRMNNAMFACAALKLVENKLFIDR